MAIPKWSNMPNWVENILIGGVVFGIGMVVSASFTMSERSSLKTTVATLEGEKARTAEENQRLSGENSRLASSIKDLTAANNSLTGDKQKLTDENKDITGRLVEANEKSYRLSQADHEALVWAETPMPEPAAKSPTPKASETEDITVYVTKSGGKYHREGCSYLRKSASPLPLSQASGRYSPCSRCNPPIKKSEPSDDQTARSDSGSSSGSSARSDDGGSRQSASDGQCTATTKKGSRCKRSARSGGRCWQHGG
jgi:hypothetical protein